jgi:hypothetical protein
MHGARLCDARWPTELLLQAIELLQQASSAAVLACPPHIPVCQNPIFGPSLQAHRIQCTTATDRPSVSRALLRQDYSVAVYAMTDEWFAI